MKQIDFMFDFLPISLGIRNLLNYVRDAFDGRFCVVI